MDPSNVLVTGAAGAVGRAVCRELVDRGHRVRGFDLLPAPHLEDHRIGDLQDAGALGAAVAGVDTVIHLAASADDADFMSELLPGNIVGVFRVFDAAREQGAPRVVLASSNMVVSGHGADRLVTLADGAASTTHYGVTKEFGEALGRMYATRYGMCVIAARLGWLPRDAAHARMLDGHELGPRMYLSPGDTGRFFARCVEAPYAQGFSVVFVTSRPRGAPFLDLEPARELVGYEPRDTWPEGNPFDLQD